MSWYRRQKCDDRRLQVGDSLGDVRLALLGLVIAVHDGSKIRTTDFRILLSICLTTALGTAGLIAKVYGLLPSH